MIVIDTSAVVAIFRQESDAAGHARAIAADDQPLISAANVLETAMVLRGLKKVAPDQAERWLDEFLQVAGIEIASVTPDQTRLARKAHIRFGKGGGHSAQLNFGDCFAYEMAKEHGCRLLYVGDDFAKTDVEGVI